MSFVLAREKQLYLGYAAVLTSNFSFLNVLQLLNYISNKQEFTFMTEKRFRQNPPVELFNKVDVRFIVYLCHEKINGSE